MPLMNSAEVWLTELLKGSFLNYKEVISSLVLHRAH